MKKISIICLSLLVSFCAKNTKGSGVLVVTGIAPVSALIQEIGGKVVTSTNIIPNSADPHSFQMKSSDAVLIAQADIVIALEDNAHTWLSYVHAEELADEVLHILSENFPEHEKTFTANHKKFVDRLQKSFKANTNKAKNTYVVQRHGAWDYLFEELGITLIGTLEEVEGSSASLKKVVSLIADINKFSDTDRVILIDDAFSSTSTSLTEVAKETGRPLVTFNSMIAPNGTSDIVSILDAHSLMLLKD